MRLKETMEPDTFLYFWTKNTFVKDRQDDNARVRPAALSGLGGWVLTREGLSKVWAWGGNRRGGTAVCLHRLSGPGFCKSNGKRVVSLRLQREVFSHQISLLLFGGPRGQCFPYTGYFSHNLNSVLKLSNLNNQYAIVGILWGSLSWAPTTKWFHALLRTPLFTVFGLFEWVSAVVIINLL